MILHEQAEELLLAQAILAVLALLLQLDIQGAFEDLTQLDYTILRLVRVCVTNCIHTMKDVIILSFIHATSSECRIYTVLFGQMGALVILPLLGFFLSTSRFYLLQVLRRDIVFGIFSVALEGLWVVCVTLTEEQCLIVGAKSDLVRIDMPQLLHLRVQLSDMLNMLAATTGLEHAPIDDLDLLEWRQLLGYVLEELACEED